MWPIITSLALAAVVAAEGRTSAHTGCLKVAKSGGNFSTIQAAVDTLSTSSSLAQCIFINPGTYNEQVLVSSRKAQLSIYGYTSDTSSYSGNRVTITNGKSQDDGLSNDETATLRVKATNFKLYNVNVENTRGQGAQALALSAGADSGYYSAKFLGFQDTVMADQGSQLYAKCLIQGATDFVFGEARAWFQHVDIRVVTKKIGYITANARKSSSSPSYYVFNNCDVAAASGNSVDLGAFFLGRPWQEYARCVFQKTKLSAVINAAGWHVWDKGDPRTGHVLFGEYGNTGDGASTSSRADFATILTSPVDINTILGSDHTSAGYYDGNYM